MRIDWAKIAAAVALALILNHARCLAACIADPCDHWSAPQDQAGKPPSCHHHKTPEPKADRGCAFPAVNNAAGVALVQPAATAVLLADSSQVPPASPALHPMFFAGMSPGSPPGPASISVLRI